jgi:hypothetical protein
MPNRFKKPLIFLLGCIIVLSIQGISAETGSYRKISSKKMLKVMGKNVTDMTKTLDKVWSKFKKERDAKEGVSLHRLADLQRVVTAMKGILRLAELNLGHGKEAYAKGNRKKLEHAFVTIQVSMNKMRELVAQLPRADFADEDSKFTQVKIEVLFEPDTEMGPGYDWDGSPVVLPSDGPGGDPAAQNTEDPIWGEHPSGFDVVPSYQRPPSASPYM